MVIRGPQKDNRTSKVHEIVRQFLDYIYYFKTIGNSNNETQEVN